MGPGPLLALLGTALLTCALDLETPRVFHGDPEGEFGASLAQFGSKWLLVGAPRERSGPNDSGAVYGCAFGSGSCRKLPLAGPEGAVNSSLGLALAAGDNAALVCGPTCAQTCGVNVHLRGFCVHLDSNLQRVRSLPDTLPECPQTSMDIAFVMDGSGSIPPRDFETMKKFIVEVMRRFRDADVLFSLTQFSSRIVHHFNFDTYRHFRDAALLLRDVEQLRGPTFTATAMRAVLTEMFVPSQGARSNARRVLIVVTDGEKLGDPLEYSDVIPQANAMKVTRYAIGVGDVFQLLRAQEELQVIASSPAQDHLFKVDNFDALANIQSQLQEKIFAIEGTQSAHSSSFQFEMAQDGFSAQVTPGGVLLGAVGAFDWSGGAFVYGRGGASAPTFINVSRAHLGTPEEARDAYLGYSAALVPLGRTWLLALGAPRWAHLGKVLLLRPGNTWTVLAEASGTQVGSYFGASLLALGPRPGEPRPGEPRPGEPRPGEPRPGEPGSGEPGSGETLKLLVGAPFYYEGGSGGRVELCELRGQEPHLRCHLSLRGSPGHPLGRFGASLAHLGDLDGDTWPEVAVGAPLEDEGRGAVYLFRGSPGGVSAHLGQRIPGSRFPSQPKFFGQSLSGGRDLSGDHLPDLAVGARGQVLLLRSPPLLQVKLQVSFEPQVIAGSALECQEGRELRTHLGTARLCFTGTKGTPDTFGSSVFVSLWFRAELDPGRARARAVFEDKNVKNGSLRLGVGKSCQRLEMNFKECPRDTVKPLELRVTLGALGEPLDGAGGLRPQLGPGSDTAQTAALPFEHDCGSDNFCQDELSVSLDFSGTEQLLVGEGQPLQVRLHLRNQGESSFGPGVELRLPEVLGYRKVEALQGSVRCQSEPSEGRGLLCQVQPPLLRAGGQVIFKVTLDVPPDAELGERLEVTATPVSDNGGAGGRGQSAEIPVRYQVFLVLTSAADSTRYLNVSVGGAPPPPAPLTHHYQVKLLGHRGLPANVTFWVPSHLGHERLWEHLEVTPEQGSARCWEAPPPPGGAWELPRERPRLVCPGPPCQEFRCSLPHLAPPQVWGFRVGGKLRLHWMGQLPQPKLPLLTSAQVSFDQRRYQNTWGRTELQVQTELERVQVPNPLPLILGASLGGLALLALLAGGLYKLGFFRRRYREMLEENEGPGETPGDPPKN